MDARKIQIEEELGIDWPAIEQLIELLVVRYDDSDLNKAFQVVRELAPIVLQGAKRLRGDDVESDQADT